MVKIPSYKEDVAQDDVVGALASMIMAQLPVYANRISDEWIDSSTGNPGINQKQKQIALLDMIIGELSARHDELLHGTIPGLIFGKYNAELQVSDKTGDAVV